MAKSAKNLTKERGKTHGSFITNALISQGLKDVIRGSSGWDELNDVHKEALDMICLKISRIMSGQADHADHWDDISGYAYLARTEKPPE